MLLKSEVVFFDDLIEKRTLLTSSYLDALRMACEEYGCRVHDYVLMTNYVYLLITRDAVSHRVITPLLSDKRKLALQKLYFLPTQEYGRNCYDLDFTYVKSM